MRNSNNKRIINIFVGALAILLLVILDQFSKFMAIDYLKGRDSISLINHVFELQYLENRGAAFGILQNQQWLFVLLFVVVLVVVGYLYCRMPLTKRFLPLQILAIMVISGGLGNLIDRVRLGFVVDFFYFSLIDFPIFNVADIYVTVSMFILFLLVFFYYKDEDFEYLISCFKRSKAKESPHGN